MSVTDAPAQQGNGWVGKPIKRREDPRLITGKGHAARPLSREQRADKLIDNATPVLGAERAQAWATRLAGFAELADVSLALRP